MSTRIASLILVLIIIIGIGVLAYRFIQSSTSNNNIKTLTINKQGKFTTDELKVSNSEVFRVKNEDNKNHTIKRKDTGATVVEVDPNSTSKNLSLEDNKQVTLFLVSNEAEQVSLITGTPPEKTAEKESLKNQNQATNQTQIQKGDSLSTNTSNQPLPQTGPKEAYIFLTLLVFGLRLAKISSKLLPN